MKYQEIRKIKHISDFILEGKIAAMQFTDKEIIEWADHITSSVSIDESVKDAYADLMDSWDKIETNLVNDVISKETAYTAVSDLEDRMRVQFTLEQDPNNYDREEVDGYKGLLMAIDHMKRYLNDLK